MKRTIILLFSFIICLGTFSQQIDSANIKQLKNIEAYTQQTKDNTSKDNWYYASFFISLFSLGIAFVTWRVSKKTLTSQRVTEENTRKWSAKQERFVIKSIVYHLVDNMSSLFLMEINDFHFPKAFLFKDMKIDINQLHVNEKFCDDVDYMELSLFYNELEMYNEYVSRWERHAEDPVPFHLCIDDYIYLFRLIDSASCLYDKMFTFNEARQRKKRREKRGLELGKDRLFEWIPQYLRSIYSEKELQMISKRNLKYAYNNSLNLLRTNSFCNYMIAPELADDEFWYSFYDISEMHEHNLGDEFTNLYNRFVEGTEKSLLFQINSNLLRGDSLLIDDSTFNPEYDVINDDVISKIRKVVTYNALRLWYSNRNNFFYYDEIDGYTFTEENGGTLYCFDHSSYKDIIRSPKRMDLLFKINVDICNSIFEYSDDVTPTELVTAINNNTEKYEYSIRPIKQIVCTNNEANGRTMISTFSVSDVILEREKDDDGSINCQLKIKLKEQLALKIV